jgi:DNA-binding XRE family transcriptional regulator
MVHRKNKNKLKKHNQRPHNLWRARKRLGLTQKQLAYLLGNKYQDNVCRLEQGSKLPTLETALMLEAILNVPVKVLFDYLFQQAQEKVKTRINKSPIPYQQLLSNPGPTLGEICTFLDLLNVQNLTPAEREKLRSHIVFLAKREAYL